VPALPHRPSHGAGTIPTWCFALRRRALRADRFLIVQPEQEGSPCIAAGPRRTRRVVRDARVARRAEEAGIPDPHQPASSALNTRRVRARAVHSGSCFSVNPPTTCRQSVPDTSRSVPVGHARRTRETTRCAAKRSRVGSQFVRERRPCTPRGICCPEGLPSQVSAEAAYFSLATSQAPVVCKHPLRILPLSSQTGEAVSRILRVSVVVALAGVLACVPRAAERQR